MSIADFDFNNLKFNLYEILNIDPNSNDKIIKKSFIRLIKTFHPDKNSKLEEEIFYHIILSNQILLNTELRTKYDKYLQTKSDTFNELKTTFNKNKVEVKTVDNSKEFNSLKNKLDIKHGYYEYKNEPVNEKYNSIKNTRNIDIDKEEFKTLNDFNTKFNDYKITGKLKNQIVEYDKNSEISTVTNDSYVNINMNELYVNDSIITNTYSSLDKAFALMPILKISDDLVKKNNEDKITDYKNFTQKMMP